MYYGYIRVSSKDQHTDRQLLTVGEYITNNRNLFIDKQSGADFKRPAYARLLKKLKKDDVVVIKSIDRLGRNYDEILEQWRIITKVKCAHIFVIDFPLLDTRNKEGSDLTGVFISDLVLQILSYVAQTEREFIHKRQSEGIAAAKVRGVRFGRAPVELTDRYYTAVDGCRNGELSIGKAAKYCDMKKSTFYKYFTETAQT